MLMSAKEHTATAVPGRKVSVKTAIVFIAALSCLVCSATSAVALASFTLSKLSSRLSSAIFFELAASSMFSLLSFMAIMLNTWQFFGQRRHGGLCC